MAIVLLAMLMAMASAETMDLNSCNVTFNLSQPHEVTMPRSEISRNDIQISEIDAININTTNGLVVLVITRANLTTQLSFADAFETFGGDLWREDTPVNTIEIDNSTGWYQINYISGIPVYTIVYYIQNPSGADFFRAPTGTKMTICCMTLSTLPLYDTADFLRSLHIKPLLET